MENAYYSWIYQEFPYTKIVFDHFHVIKLMNDKLNKVRRIVTAKLNLIQQKQLKGLRFIFLKNNENLPEDAKIILRNMRGEFQELGNAYMFKEILRANYSRAQTSYIPELLSLDRTRRGNTNPELRTTAKTVEEAHLVWQKLVVH